VPLLFFGFFGKGRKAVSVKRGKKKVSGGNLI
jgi:hypothetical protein